MKMLFLRGMVDARTGRPKCIEDDDDMWTQLAFAMTGPGDETKVLYWGGHSERYYRDNFKIQWVHDFEHYRSTFKPDVIFTRGGFPEYDRILKDNRDAFSIYYGAGRRSLPTSSFRDYNVILVDTWEDHKKGKVKFPKSIVRIWAKPAADNIMRPIRPVMRIWDVCFPANGTQLFKGFQFVYKTVPPDLRVLNLGYPQKKFKRPKNVQSIRVKRRDIAQYYSSCKVGIVCTKEIDSAPRVIPEMLACGLPVIALDRVRFHKAAYFFESEQYGAVRSREQFWPTVREWLQRWTVYTPEFVAEHYKRNLSLECAARDLRETIFFHGGPR